MTVNVSDSFFANQKSVEFSDSFTSDSDSTFVLERLLLSFVSVRH